MFKQLDEKDRSRLDEEYQKRKKQYESEKAEYESVYGKPSDHC
jgi:hypothetical protein